MASKRVTAEKIRELWGGENKTLLSPKSSGRMTTTARYITQEARRAMAASSSEQVWTEDHLLDVVKSVESSQGEELSAFERSASVAALSDSFQDYGVLSGLINSKDVNDVIVRSYDDVSVQIGRKNVQTDIAFSDHDSYIAFIESLLKKAGKACTLATPIVDAALDQHIRACVTHESLSPEGSGPMLTLRISRYGHIDLASLVRGGCAPSIIMDYLSSFVGLGHGAMLIAGEVGTGKTTLVRALASSLSPEDALLVIEDTNEISLNRKFTRTLLTREHNTEGAGKVSPAQAIRAGMRMAMNRIILGEIRDCEAAEAFIDVCSSGHSGMSTIHARSARDAVGRLELFLARAQGDVGIETIRRQIANAISVLVYLSADSSSGCRFISSVHEIQGASDGMVQLSPIFIHEDGHWLRAEGLSEYYSLMKSDGLVLPEVGQILM